MNIGNAIRTVRLDLGLPQKDLAKMSQISSNSLSQIETGSKYPASYTIGKICSALDIPVQFLYMVAIEEKDIAPAKKHMYRIIHPVLVDMIIQLAGPVQSGMHAPGMAA